MVGITSYGIHIPRYRIGLGTIASAWGGRSKGGEKAVANYDEDSLTMAVSAVLDCLGRSDDIPPDVEALFFASTTSPFGEKLASPLIALAADLPSRLRSSDCLGSLRSGAIALSSAVDSVKCGATRGAVIVSSDCRMAQPGSEIEGWMGDGAAALRIGTDSVLAEIRDSFSISDEFTHFWRRKEDKYVRIGDVRFGQIHGYMRLMTESIQGVMSKNGQKPSDFAKVVLSPIDRASHLELARALGFRPKEQVQDALLDAVGNVGAAHPFLLLIAALEDAKPHDKILFATFGDGSDAFVLEVTEAVERIKGRSSIHEFARSRRLLDNYSRLLSFRHLISDVTSPVPFSSFPLLYRERDQNVRFYGSICQECQTVQFLKVRICPHCKSKDRFQPVKLAKEGKLFTYTFDHYYPVLDPPSMMALVDISPGARVTVQMTDTDPEWVGIGMDVELTYRKYHEGLNIPNYFWKCRAREVPSQR